jgi:hypothetical protein
MGTLTPSSVFSSLPQELQAYIQACEHLMSAFFHPDHAPLSVTEQEILQYYIEELQAHLLAPQTTNRSREQYLPNEEVKAIRDVLERLSIHIGHA